MVESIVAEKRQEARMASVDSGVLAIVALSLVALSVLVSFSAGNPMFSLLGGGTLVAVFLFVVSAASGSISSKPVGVLGAERTNTLAIIAFVAACGFGLAVVSIVLGHLSRSQISRLGGRGDKLALAALIIGYSEVLLAVLGVFWVLAAIQMG